MLELRTACSRPTGKVFKELSCAVAFVLSQNKKSLQGLFLDARGIRDGAVAKPRAAEEPDRGKEKHPVFA
jgi:hypothetical protein